MLHNLMPKDYKVCGKLASYEFVGKKVRQAVPNSVPIENLSIDQSRSIPVEYEYYTAVEVDGSKDFNENGYYWKKL